MAYIKLEDLKKYPIRINHYDKDNGNRDFVLGVESVIEYAESLPSADVEEVRHGEWTFGGDGVVVCTICKETLDSYVLPRNFCPNCGAKMDGGKAE